MAKIETYACDICGATKGESNGWYVAFVNREGFRVLLWKTNLDSPSEGTWQIWHLCGSQCLLEWVSQTVDKLSGVKEG